MLKTTNLYTVYTARKLYYEDFYTYIFNVDFIYITEAKEVLQQTVYIFVIVVLRDIKKFKVKKMCRCWKKSAEIIVVQQQYSLLLQSEYSAG